MKRIVIYFTLVLVPILLTACAGNGQVDLTNITCDGIQLGDSIENVAVEGYTLSDRFPEEDNTINFEEWRITTDNENVITRIYANFSSIEIAVNSQIYRDMIDDIIIALGDHHSTDWYDREQQLKQAVYIDHDNHIQATFVYDNHSNQLVWVILEIVD